MQSGAELLAVDMWKVQELFGLCLFGFLFIFMAWRIRPYDKFTPVAAVYFMGNALYNSLALPAFQILMFYLFSFTFEKLPPGVVKGIIYGVTAIVVGDAIFLLLGNKFGAFNHFSFDTTIMALVLVWIMCSNLRLWKAVAAVPLLGAILWFRGSTAAACFFVGCFVNSVMKREWGWVIFFFILAALGLSTDPAHFMGSSGRVEMWRAYFNWWAENGNGIFGTGLGSFEFIGPSIPVNGTQYRFMHSDFLQVLFETGLVGLFFFVGLWCLAFYRARNYRALPLVAAFFVACMNYFPLHFFFSQLWAFLLFDALRFRQKEEYDRKNNSYIRQTRQREDDFGKGSDSTAH